VRIGAYRTDTSAVKQEKEQSMSSPKRLARIAGLLYLIVGIFGGFAIAYVTATVYVPGDAATTAGNLLTNAGLVRLGVIADLRKSFFCEATIGVGTAS
jgi:hypothetical protein